MASVRATSTGLFAQSPPSAKTFRDPPALLGSPTAANDRKIGAALEAMQTSTSEKSLSRTPLTGVRLKTQDRCVDMSTAGTDNEIPRLSNTSATVMSRNTSLKADRRAKSPARTNRLPLNTR